MSAQDLKPLSGEIEHQLLQAHEDKQLYGRLHMEFQDINDKMVGTQWEQEADDFLSYLTAEYRWNEQDEQLLANKQALIMTMQQTAICMRVNPDAFVDLYEQYQGKQWRPDVAASVMATAISMECQTLMMAAWIDPVWLTAPTYLCDHNRNGDQFADFEIYAGISAKTENDLVAAGVI